MGKQHFAALSECGGSHGRRELGGKRLRESGSIPGIVCGTTKAELSGNRAHRRRIRMTLLTGLVNANPAVHTYWLYLNVFTTGIVDDENIYLCLKGGGSIMLWVLHWCGSKINFDLYVFFVGIPDM